MSALRPKPADYIIISLMFLCGMVGFWNHFRQPVYANRHYAAIYLENRLVAELSFSDRDAFQYSFPFGEAGEHTAVLEVEGGRLRMLPLDKEICPEGICSHTGWISRSHESIVCLPNRILVTFIDSPPDAHGLDVETY